MFESLPRHLAKSKKSLPEWSEGFRGRELDDASFSRSTGPYKCHALLAFRISRGSWMTNVPLCAVHCLAAPAKGSTWKEHHYLTGQSLTFDALFLTCDVL